MKAKEIRDLIDFIAATGLEEVNIETEEFKIKVKKTPNQSVSANQTIPSPAPSIHAPQVAPAKAAEAPTAVPSPTAPADNLITIKSPMIGTFYESANPESPAFINIGDTVKVGDTVCIIEAMKLFNEIESEISGKVVKILVGNAQPVEFDQPLFLIDPS